MSRDCCVALPAVPWVCLQFKILVFPDHTHLLFWMDYIVHCSRPLLSEMFAFEAIILTSWWQTVSGKCSGINWRNFLVVSAKLRQIKGISNVCFKNVSPPNLSGSFTMPIDIHPLSHSGVVAVDWGLKIVKRGNIFVNVYFWKYFSLIIVTYIQLYIC